MQFEFQYKVSDNPERDLNKKTHKDIHPVNLKYKEIKEEALVRFVEENFWQKLYVY